MSMLSRVAETLYWLARYIERAENTARVLNVNTHLLLDTGRRAAVGWEPVIEILGLKEAFFDRFRNATERNAARYLIGDDGQPGVIVGALGAARENARTVRDFLPQEAWEHLNELHHRAVAEAAAGVTQRGRHDYLTTVIRGAQTLTGLLAGTMTHDEGYMFLRAGRNLERTDMTTRIIDVRSASLLPDEAGNLPPFEAIQWLSVLKSLSAHQMFRRRRAGPPRRETVLDFLLREPLFPRSCGHGLGELADCLATLPRNDRPLRAVAALQRQVDDADPSRLDPVALHTFIDELQIGLIEVHRQMEQTWFRPGVDYSDQRNRE